MIRRYGSAQVRNAATLGGNVANGSPIGDNPPVLIALGATLHLRLGDERRAMPVEAFFLDYGRQDRAAGRARRRRRGAGRGDGPAGPQALQALRPGHLGRLRRLRHPRRGRARRLRPDRLRRHGRHPEARGGGRGGAGRPALERGDGRRPPSPPSPTDFTPLSDMRASAAYRLEAARTCSAGSGPRAAGEAIAVQEVAP